MSVVVIPGLKVLSPNKTSGEHWSKRYRRSKDQHEVIGWTLLARLGRTPPSLPVTVTLTRCAPKPFDAHENLPMAFKHVVDAVAKHLGVDDADPRVTWRYEQERGAYGVRIAIEQPVNNNGPDAVTTEPLTKQR